MTGSKAFITLVAAVAVGAGAWLWHASAGPQAVLDLADRSVDPFAAADAKATVLVFVRTDCPISNRYAPEMRRLFDLYAPRDVAFWLVYVDPTETAAEIGHHLAEYDYPLPALRDMRHALVDMSEVAVTPEAAVFAPDGELIYRGRIDNRYTDFGKGRAAPTRRDLEEALDAVLAGRPLSQARTPAVGCYIEDLR
ncbi:MAG: redoxin domain-containing protein [Candidatus Latescibacterota bacterium]|nr:redoxin domain-containing protein [Candidatus Latescibacterota bacterium]